MKQRLIIDTDAGVDDAIALLMALSDPSAEVVAITTVSGNVPVDRVIRNVGIVLDFVGAGAIPIFRGAAQPLVGPPIHAMEIHGQDGLGDAGFPPSSRSPDPDPAPWAIVNLARRFAGELLLIALGPLTNVALAVALEPELPRLLGGFLWMGGAIRAQGNTTPVAEFNAYADPEAAAAVFARGMDPIVVPWETVVEAFIPWEDWDRLLRIEPLGPKVIAPMTARLQQLLKARGWPGMVLADPVAMVVALNPASARLESWYIEVETVGAISRGLTAVDRMRLRGRPPNARVATAVDRSILLQMLGSAFRRSLLEF